MSKLKIFIISGGAGASGEQLVKTILAQFDNANVDVEIIPNFLKREQIPELVAKTRAANSVVVHTLVDAAMREHLTRAMEEHHIITIDLIGRLMQELTRLLQQDPLGEPGRYRELQESYFKRIAAMEFAVEHDDGKRAHELPLADVVLTGVSRVGKTPLSMFLSTVGWKVANVPLVQNVSPPEELFQIDRRRVIGLTVEAGQLVQYRKRRQHHLGAGGRSEYVDPEAIYEELEFAKRIFRRGQFTRINMTDKPIEEAADDVSTIMRRRFEFKEM